MTGNADRANRRLAWRTEGSQLLEFALALPLLLILLIGICDFALAMNIKHILNNAAREGARIGAAQPVSDLTNTNPVSVTVIRDAVVDYLSGAGIDTTFIPATPTSATPCAGGTPGACTWTYNGLKIERNVLVTGSTGTMMSTRVTLTYQYNWTFGFNRVVKLAVPSADYGTNVTISTDAVMANIGAL